MRQLDGAFDDDSTKNTIESRRISSVCDFLDTNVFPVTCANRLANASERAQHLQLERREVLDAARLDRSFALRDHESVQGVGLKREDVWI